MTKANGKDAELLEMAPLKYYGALKGEDWVGGDGDKWRDIAVDSTSPFAVVWVRRRLKDNKYFLVVSVVKAHVLAYELTLQEAKELYRELPHRAPYEKSFKVPKKKEKSEENLDNV